MILESFFNDEYTKIDKSLPGIISNLQKYISTNHDIKDYGLKDKNIREIEKNLKKYFNDIFKVKMSLYIIEDRRDPQYNCGCIPMFTSGEVEVDKDKLILKSDGIKDITLVLFTSTIEILTPREHVAVIMHEVGHAFQKKYEVALPYVVTTFFSKYVEYNIPGLIAAGFLYAVSYFLKTLSYLKLLPAFFAVSLFSLIYKNYRSRDIELKCDEFAARMGYGHELKSALQKITEKAKQGFNRNAVEWNPFILFIKFVLSIKEKFLHIIAGSSHPSMSKREENIDKIHKEITDAFEKGDIKKLPPSLKEELKKTKIRVKSKKDK